MSSHHNKNYFFELNSIKITSPTTKNKESEPPSGRIESQVRATLQSATSIAMLGGVCKKKKKKNDTP